MGADNALDVVGTASGAYTPAKSATGDGPRLRAHFRSDAARLAKASEADGEALVIDGVIAQMIYVGQGYRYRVRAAGADIWVHAPERVAEGGGVSGRPSGCAPAFSNWAIIDDREVA
jgi:hypothetical protein